MLSLSLSHDDGAASSGGDLVGHQGLLPVVEAEPAARAVISPVAVVVAKSPAPATPVAHLIKLN